MNKEVKGETLSNTLEITEPFIMIDSFRLSESGDIGYGLKSVTDEEWFFNCHLQSQMVMPATLQIEGMLQTLVMLIYQTFDHGKKRSFVTEIDVKMLSTINPGIEITYEAKILKSRNGIFKGQVIGISNSRIKCKGMFTFASPHLMNTPKIN